MKAQPFYLLCVSLVQMLSASDNCRISKEMLPLLPSEKVIDDAVVVPQSAYYFLPNGVQHAVILGPLAPCVGVQITHQTLGHLFIHVHHENCRQELIKKAKACLGSCDEKHLLDLTLFTRTDAHHCKEFPFKEGSHEKRAVAIADTIQEVYTARNERIYYHQTIDPIDDNADRSDRWIIFVDKKLYRFDPWKLKIIRSREGLGNYSLTTLQKACRELGVATLKSLPLYPIKGLNLKEINGEKLSLFTRKTFVYTGTAVVGIAAGLLLLFVLKQAKNKMS